MQNKQSGFTVLELIIVIAVLIALGTVFFVQRRDLEVMQRDSDRKTAINAIYYNLEDVYRPANRAYPEVITADVLKGIDPSLLKDPDGVMIGEEGSNYRYTPQDCKDSKCASYELRADLEHEGDFIKFNR